MKFLTVSTFVSSFIVSVTCRAVDLSSRQDSYPSNFKPNFDSAFNVTIQKPLSTVFPILGTNEGLGPHILLSSIASGFQALTKDTVAVSGNLEDAFVRTLAADSAGAGFPRQGFQYKETVKIIPGVKFLDIVVNLKGTFTWDENRKLSLYETTSDKSVTVRKVRRFEEVDGGAATLVSETITGQCPFLLQPITQKTARDAHKEQMNLYSTLFK
ncbi:hypothetical protein B0H15DRAFT_862149 [Mycena belliarum]|uniref:Uncharacterized protein n=1 Tax=Mycena belliarum TaxID=1033014 RepID=A0AAD6TRW2_9AGAR|nr:hypothetical protein B0H15DRAFT_862149 [Mycena belliae]